MAAESGFWAGENIEYRARTCVQVCAGVCCVYVCALCILTLSFGFPTMGTSCEAYEEGGGKERSKQYCMFSYGIQATSLSTHQC